MLSLSWAQKLINFGVLTIILIEIPAKNCFQNKMAFDVIYFGQFIFRDLIVFQPNLHVDAKSGWEASKKQLFTILMCL